ncbi:YndJ family transporter [Natrarchaeobius sp. A-rgal3]|uniref:YndJ family transporter n=1 Tax=Natrarchaeobius versutus TaxID=1679078 RepID=UPI00350E8E0D
MTDLETATRAATPAPEVGVSTPRLAGRRVTDLSAVLGAVVWLALVAVSAPGAGWIALSPVELYVALATFVLVPLGIGLVPREHRGPARHSSGGRTPRLYPLAVVGQFPAATAAVAAMALPRESLAAVALVVPWLAVTAILAVLGVRNLRSRGVGPLPALAVDAALLYVPVAPVALLLSVAGVSVGFAPIIVLLTAVHFHYAGFVLPLVVGLVARVVADDREFPPTLAGRAAAASTVAVVVGILAVAVGITVSPLLEFVAVVPFVAGVVCFAGVTIRGVVPVAPRIPGVLLLVASLSLCTGMTFALAFSYSSLPGTAALVTIPEMVRWHGAVNAFGFALPALVAFRLLE